MEKCLPISVIRGMVNITIKLDYTHTLTTATRSDEQTTISDTGTLSLRVLNGSATIFCGSSIWKKEAILRRT